MYSPVSSLRRLWARLRRREAPRDPATLRVVHAGGRTYVLEPDGWRIAHPDDLERWRREGRL